MIVKVRELDSFMDRTSNSCFSETLVELKIEESIRKIVIFVNFFKIQLYLPLHATSSLPNASTICSSLYFSARISLTGCIGSSAIFLKYTLLQKWHINIAYMYIHRKKVTISLHLYFNYSNNFNFIKFITRRNHMIVFNCIPRCKSC